MKKGIILFLLILSFLKVSAQETITPTLSKEAYLKKSKAQKTTAWLLLAGGTGLLIGSVATSELNFFGNSYSGNLYFGTGTPPPTSGEKTDNSTSTFLGFASAGALLGSVIYFSLAHQNKKKATLVTISRQQIFISHQRNPVIQTMPAISLKINL